MASDDLGSISRALIDGGTGNREWVMNRAIELYSRLWSSIARQILPEHRRRAADHDDAVQETLIELDRILRRPGHTLRSREDIRRLGARILSCNAKDVLEANLQFDGQSVVANQDRSESSSDSQELLGDVAGRCSPSVSPTAKLEATEIQGRLDAFGQAVELELSQLPDLDRKIVENWLEWKSYRAIAAELGITVRDVRNTTFDFKATPSLSLMISDLRTLLTESEADESGVVNRVNLSVRSGRLLCDLREDS